MADLLAKVKKAKRVFIIGNGGSYANAIHICNDLLGAGKPAFAPDPATLTAFANDWGYETVFARWLGVVARRGDLLIALSGSGTSENIRAGIDKAKKIGLSTHLVSWYLKDGMDMQLSEEAQLVIGHHLMRGLRGRG